jgi:RNA polymerase sigma-70 factor (ECF subfamily)
MDDALIRAASQGDTVAFEQLAQRYDQAVLRLTVHLTGSEEDGQDIYQKAFLRAYIQLPHFHFECSFYTWIYRIATNLCLDYLRCKRSQGRGLTATNAPDGGERKTLDLITDQSASARPMRNPASHVLREQVVRALRQLSPSERVVFELRHYHGLQLRTVAGILQTSEDTVKSTFVRATHKLRLQLPEV